jgi:hypothetical protein
VGEMIVFCVVLAIVLPVLALGDLKTLLALFLKQKRVRKFTLLKQKSDFYFLDMKKNQ